MKIAITGASGHIGANMCRSLLEKGHVINALIHAYRESLEGLDVHQVKGDLLNPGSLDSLLDGAEIVIHLGASISIDRQSANNVFNTNYTGTKNVLATVKRHSSVKRVIHFSSIHALENNPVDKPLDESRSLVVGDSNNYNHSKAMAEQLVLEEVESGLDAVIISPTSVIGPYDYKPSLVGQALIQLYNNSLPALLPGGYNWVDVRDVVAGTIDAIDKGRKGERYLLSGRWESLVNLNRIIKNIHSDTKTLPVFPYWVALLGVPFLKVWARILDRQPLYTSDSINILKTGHRNILSDKAQHELDYHSRTLEETIGDTLNWFKQHEYIS